MQFWTLALGLLTVSVEKPNEIVCAETFGPFLTRCRVSTREILPRQPYQADFYIRYLYQCSGGPLDVFLEVDEAQIPLSRGTTFGTLQVTGEGPVSLQMQDPLRAEKVHLAKNCLLRIDEARASPSFETLSRWRENAEAIAESLRDKTEKWRLTQNIEKIKLWDDRQYALMHAALMEILATHLANVGVALKDCTAEGRLLRGDRLPDGWWVALTQMPEMADDIMLIAFIESAIEGRPPVVAEEDIVRAASRVKRSLSSRYQAELAEKIQQAANLSALLKQVEQKADADLASCLAEIRKILQDPASRLTRSG